jgi:hypothetical protein
MTPEEFKERYINWLRSRGFTSVEAGRLYDKGKGEFDYGYTPEWYAREQWECNK